MRSNEEPDNNFETMLIYGILHQVTNKHQLSKYNDENEYGTKRYYKHINDDDLISSGVSEAEKT